MSFLLNPDDGSVDGGLEQRRRRLPPADGADARAGSERTHRRVEWALNMLGSIAIVASPFLFAYWRTRREGGHGEGAGDVGEERETIAHLQDLAKALETAPLETRQFIAEWNADVTAEYEEKRRRKGGR